MQKTMALAFPLFFSFFQFWGYVAGVFDQFLEDQTSSVFNQTSEEKMHSVRDFNFLEFRERLNYVVVHETLISLNSAVVPSPLPPSPPHSAQPQKRPSIVFESEKQSPSRLMDACPPRGTLSDVS